MSRGEKIYSMTGYAVQTLTHGQRTLRLNIKSVNHRFFELRWKAPREWAAHENEARVALKDILKRGSVDFWVEEEAHTQKQSGSAALFERLNAALKNSDSVASFALPRPLRAMILSRYPDFWLHEGQKQSDVSADEAMTAVRELAQKLQTARLAEGEKTHAELLKQAAELRQLRTHLGQEVPKMREEWERLYRERIVKLAQEVQVSAPSEERVLQELLLLAERRDVSEELQRIDAHLDALDEQLKKIPDTFGKRLEFLVQELHREWTTLGNKIKDPERVQHIMEAKLVLERIREQCLNIA